MIEDDFLKEKQNIRQKMLKFSRAMNYGKELDEDLQKEISSNDILRRRIKKKKSILDDFEEEYSPKESKKSNIYLKEDLINVKLEEKQSLARKFLAKIKKLKERKKEKKQDKKKLFSFLRKKKQNSKAEISKQIKPNENLKPPLKPEIKNLDLKENLQVLKTPNLEKKPILKEELEIPKKPDLKQSFENLQKINQNINFKAENKEEENSQIAKDSLLDGFSKATKEDKNLNFNQLLFAALLVSFSLFLFAPQIYIRNQIYYLSREIATLRTEESVLSEENKELKRKLENIRFQNQILDYLD